MAASALNLAVFCMQTAPYPLPYPHSPQLLDKSSILYVVATDAINDRADVVTVATLAGWLARERVPEIFTVQKAIDDPEDSNAFWLRQLAGEYGTINTTFLADSGALLAHFAPRMSGYVRFDLDSKFGSANAAITRCSAGNGLVAAGTAATAALLESLGVPLQHDSTKETASAAFEASKATLSDRLATFAPNDGSKAHCMAGYAVFSRSPVIEFPASGDAASVAVIARLNASTHAGVAMGWHSGDEFEYVKALSRGGAWAHASDWSQDLYALSNLAAHSNALARPRTTPPRGLPLSAATHAHESSAMPGAGRSERHAERRPVQAAHTVAFVMSDGDNLCWLQGDWRKASWYGSPDRGAVPIGWTFAPAAAELIPTVLEGARRGATVNDSFIAGPSGAGYYFPDAVPIDRRDAFQQATGQLMELSGMDLLNVIGAAPAAEALEPLLASAAVRALFFWTYGAGYSGMRGNVAWLGGKLVVGGRVSLWGESTDVSSTMVGPEALVRVLSSLPKDPTHPNSYSLIPVHAWSHNTSSVRHVAEALEALGGFDVVSPSELVERLTAFTPHTSMCPMPRGSWSQVCLDCTLSGNGTCVLDCNNCGGKRAACDLSVCSDALTIDSHMRFVCEDGTLCPAGREPIGGM